ncbi:hypothetical protein HRE46_03135 [Enterococcus faecalis]|nr:hypothetical protein [Enterococcus faecalis]
MKKYDSKVTMLEDFEMRGLWYLPESDLDNGIYGTLTFTHSIISLKLMGNFVDFHDHKNSVDDSVICGFSENGKYVYLDSCFITKQTNNMPGIGMSEYQVNSLFISSKPISLIDDLNVTKFAFSFDSYESWDKSSPIEIFMNTAEKSESVNYSQESLKSIENSYLIENDTMEFFKKAVVTRRHIDGFTKLEISLKKHFEIKILNNSVFSFDNLKDSLLKINNFYSIFWGQRLNNKLLKIFTDSQEISVFFVQRIANSKKTVLDYENIHESIETIFHKFEKEYDSLQVILNTRANQSFKNGFDSDTFIDTSKNLEVFARQYLNTNPELPTNYEEIKNELFDILELKLDQNIINQSDYQFFENKINFLGERALRWKITNCIKLLPEELLIKLFGSEKRSKTINNFCRSIADTRNYLTHGDSLSKYELAITNARDLYYVTLKLQCILDVLILKKLDLDDLTIVKSISKYDGPYQSLFY